MKKNDLENKALIITYFILAVIILITGCMFFAKCRGTVDSSSSIAEVIEVTTASLDVSTETTESTTETSSISTYDETTSSVDTTIEVITQEQNTESSSDSVKASTNVITENSTQTSTTHTSPASTKTVDEIAKEVLYGYWGNGYERKNRLEANGYNYEEIQNKVSELREQFSTTIVATTTTKVVTTVATTSSTIVTTTVSTDTSNGTNKQFVKTFSRGTYYAYGGARRGGSGRDLIDCSIGNGTVKGSIASSYLYRNYGYNYNGSRTKVYLEVKGYSSMNGYYYLDDSDAGNPNVIDFFYYTGGNCQFCRQGVVQVDCYIVQ